VDPAWKKVSGKTYAGGTPAAGDATILTPINTINDLAFSHVGIAINGNNVMDGNNVLAYTLDYDVEFRKPLSQFQNV